QGKEVFAVPGPISSARSTGTNQLLKDGARLVTSADDILEELRGVGHGFAAAPASAPAASTGPAASPDIPPPPPPDLSPDEAKVYASLTAEPLHVDDLAAASGLAPSNVLAALLGLELRDLAESLPGKQYRLKAG